MNAGESVGAPHCALCRDFNHTHNGHESCDGCPVQERTGYRGCVGSPYEPFEVLALNMTDSAFDLWILTDEAKALAAEELAFLKSLLP